MVILLCLLVLLGGIVFGCQHKMIYHPRGYPGDASMESMVRLEYDTDQGAQTSFYYADEAHPDVLPEKVWIIFGGNATVALDWYGFAKGFSARESTGFLLMEYPGYGLCAGRPSSKSILTATRQAVAKLSDYLQTDPRTLEGRISVVGHSLGAAAALQYAVTIPVEKVVLISPFSSLRDMAALVVGIPLNYLLFENYDNRARLRELFDHTSFPDVVIIHGTQDEVIPVRMGRELSGLSSRIIYKQVDNCGHNSILSIAEERIYAAMRFADL